MSRFSDLNNHKHTEEEEEADVSKFESFGFFPTVVKIARERGMHNNEVLNMTAIEVMTEILYDYAKSTYSKDLNDIQQRNADHASKTKE